MDGKFVEKNTVGKMNKIYKYIKANYNIATRCTLNGGRCRNICKAI